MLFLKSAHKLVSWQIFCLFTLIFILSVNLTQSYSFAQSTSLYVQVRQSTLREQPKFWGKAIANLEYGTPLTAVSASPDDKSWLKVKLGEQEGFVHVGAITKRKIVLSSNNKNYDRKVDSISVSLAGKGFNSKIENMYASSKGIDYSVVDAVEAKKISNDEFYAFLSAGKLNEK